MSNREQGGILATAHDTAAALAAKRAAAAGADDDDAGEYGADESDESPEENEDPAEGADSDPDAAAEGDDDHDSGDQDDDDEPEGDDSPVITAPASWPKDRLEDWDALSDAAKQVFADREAEIQSAMSEKGREAAEARRQADEEKSRLTKDYSERIAKLDALLPTISERFKAKYEGVDWKKLASEDPEQYVELKAEFEADKEASETAAKEAADARKEAVAGYQQEQFSTLTERNPHYQGEAGKKLLAEEAGKVEQFARTLNGVTDEHLSMLSADVYEVLRDAMAFRNATKTATKPAKKPAQKSVKPGARQSSGEKTKKAEQAARDRVKTATGRNAQDRAIASLLAMKRRKA